MDDLPKPTYEELEIIGEKLVSQAFETAQKKETVPLAKVIDQLEAYFPGPNYADFRRPVRCEKNPENTENYLVFDKLIENPFVYKCGEECRRSLSNFAANLGGSIDYLMWIVICSIPLATKCPPEFQALLNLYLRVIYNYCSTGNCTQLFKLEPSMTRSIIEGGKTVIAPRIGSGTNYLELGPNPIVWMTRKASITGRKVNLKKPDIEPVTEELWKTLKTPETFSKYLSKADTKYRMTEQAQRESEPQRFFDENIANSLFQALFCPNYTVELENAELLENSLMENVKIEERVDVCEYIDNFLSVMSDTYRWVQYIRAYIQKDAASQEYWATEIIREDENSLTEKFCLFDAIHSIFTPTTLECTLRAD